jgi:hypothetical protein
MTTVLAGKDCNHAPLDDLLGTISCMVAWRPSTSIVILVVWPGCTLPLSCSPLPSFFCCRCLLSVSYWCQWQAMCSHSCVLRRGVIARRMCRRLVFSFNRAWPQTRPLCVQICRPDSEFA